MTAAVQAPAAANLRCGWCLAAPGARPKHRHGQPSNYCPCPCHREDPQ